MRVYMNSNYLRKIGIILVSKCRFSFTFERFIPSLLNINNSFMIQLEIH